MIYYKSIKVIVDITGIAIIIINIIIRNYDLLDIIVINQKSLFTSKYWLLLYYLLLSSKNF